MADTQAATGRGPSSVPDRDLPAEEAQPIIDNDSSQTAAAKSTSTSKDPNDPQNWPPWHKLLTYLSICSFSFIANVNASNFTVATLALRKYFLIDATHVVYLTALNVLMFGIGNLLWIPVMRITGKRPVYLTAILVLLFSNIWSAKAGSYGSLLASRMISGVGASAADATVPSAVGELYGQRERGSKMMYFHLALASGIFLGPVINAYVVQEYGWRWSPAWIAIACGVVFVLAVFFIHETQYGALVDEADWKPRRSFWSYLSLTKGIDHDRPGRKAFQALKDILIMTTFPPILFASSLVGIFVGWTIIIQVSIANTFLSPPYLWTLARVGLLHIAGWVGAVSAIYFGGMVIDWLVAQQDLRKRRKKDKHHHDHDHEHGHKNEHKHKHDHDHDRPNRLIALIIPFSIAPAGLVVYGVCLAQGRRWIIPAVGYAMHSFGFVAVSNIVVVYAVDAYREVSGEAMVVLFIIRNVVAVVCSIYCFLWIQRDGLKAVFGTMAGLEWGLMLLGIPMFWWADKIKAFTYRYGPMKRINEKKGVEERRKMNRESMIQGGWMAGGRE